MLQVKEWVFLDDYISSKIIKAFATQKDAQKYSKQIGWKSRDVLNVERRFESVWIVGHKHIHTETIGNERTGTITFEIITLPIGYENINGVETMKTVEVKRYKKY